MPKVIVSRKGFDASAGGAPSPILPDGRMISLPIPERGTGARYADLRTRDGRRYLDVMRDAGIRRVRAGGRWVPLDRRLEAHVDPDLVAATRPRPGRWRAAFGQAGAAQTILSRAGVGPGDLFLFFGWFRHADDRRRRDLHVVWGWLRVGAVLTPAAAGDEHADHPHVVVADRTNNTLYIAADEAFPGIPGAGVLDHHPRRVLTAPDALRRTDWLLPASVRAGCALARHRTRFSEGGRFDARYQWQELVADGAGTQQWARSLLTAGG